MKLTNKPLNSLFIIDLECDKYNVIDNEEYSLTNITVNYKNYNLLHGFPGDNPTAIILDTSGNNILLAHFGEAQDMEIERCATPKQIIDVNEMYNWYMHITDDMCNYTQFEAMNQVMLIDYWKNMKSGTKLILQIIEDEPRVERIVKCIYSHTRCDNGDGDGCVYCNAYDDSTSEY